MKIYVTHSTGFDFQNELYGPLRKSELNMVHEIVLPHEQSSEQDEYENTEDMVKKLSQYLEK